jgi:hypothetical protein
MPQGKNLIQTLYNAGFRGDALRSAWAIVMRESGGRADAFNGNTGTGDQSYGMFQINMLGDLGPARRRQFGLKSNADLLDPNVNAQVAFRMSQGGKNFGAWAIGPNAYKGAPADAKSKYRDWLTKYPGDNAKAQIQRGGQTFGASYAGSPQQAEIASADSARKLTANWLLARGAALRSGTGGGPDLAGLLQLGRERRALQQSMAPQAPHDNLPNTAIRGQGSITPTTLWKGGGGKGGIRELFYDPLGAYDEGNWIKPIGGHADHVHVSFGTPQAAISAIRLARSLGLRASENPYAEGSEAEAGVHTPSSYHYQSFPGKYGGGRSTKVGRGLDVSGSPAKMAQFYRALKAQL